MSPHTKDLRGLERRYACADAHVEIGAQDSEKKERKRGGAAASASSAWRTRRIRAKTSSGPKRRTLPSCARGRTAD